MKTCIKCGSHAFNLYAEGIDQGGFCDVHYWQGRAHRAEAQPEKELVAEAYALADKVRTELDKKCCPVAYMNVAWEAVVTNYRDLIHTTPPKHLWVDLTDANMKVLIEQARVLPKQSPCPDYNVRLLMLTNAVLKELNT